MPEFAMQPWIWTEKETEEWLELSTRTVPWQNGEEKPLTEMTMFWAAYDFLVNGGHFTPQCIAELAETNRLEVGGTYEHNFKGFVSYASKARRKTEDEVRVNRIIKIQQAFERVSEMLRRDFLKAARA